MCPVVVVVLFLALALALTGCHPTQYAAVTRYAAPTGTGATCTSPSTPCTLQTALSQAQAGDTIRLAKGRYTGTSGMLAPPGNKAGTSSSRITVEAEDDGAVLIDGQGQRRPLSLTGGNHYWTIRGLNVCCAHDTTVQVGTNANYNRLERLIAWDQEDPSAGVITIWQSTGTVLTDVAAWGKGRKMFAVISDSQTVVNRGFFIKFNVMDTSSGDDVTATFAYKSRTNKFYNVIAAMDVAPGALANTVYIFGPDHYQDTTGYVTTHDVRGSIVYVVDGQQIANTQIGLRVGFNPSNAPPGNVITTVSRNNLTLRRTSDWSNAAHDCPENGTTSICDKAQWTDSVGTLEGGTHTTDAAAIPPSATPDLLRLQATSQPASGAWVKHCYEEDGTLDQGCDVWPWKMGDRIAEALVTSGYHTRGLDGKGETDLTALILRLAGSTLAPVPPTPAKPAFSCVGQVELSSGKLALACAQPGGRR